MNSVIRLIILVLALSAWGCASQIQHNLDERDANEIVSVLVARGFKADKVSEKGKKPTWAVEVGSEEATAALGVLTELKLPRAQRLKTQTIAQGTSLIETPAVEKLRQLEAQEGDLEEALESMDGVVSAAVEIVVPPPARPSQVSTPSKASVLLRAHASSIEHLQRDRAELRALVAASVDGLKADEVIVVIDTVTKINGAEPQSPRESLRPLVLGLGVALATLAALLVLAAWRLTTLRRLRHPETTAATILTSVPPTTEPSSTSGVLATVSPRQLSTT
jgi:type III secretion protein J